MYSHYIHCTYTVVWCIGSVIHTEVSFTQSVRSTVCYVPLSSSLQTSGDGPFIVSQLQGKRPQRRGGSQTMQRRTVLWVVHDPAEISMDVTNPLDFELRVENMVCTPLIFSSKL